MWLLDEVHSLRQTTLLDFDLRVAPMVEGGSRAYEHFGIPFGAKPRLINGFIYQQLIFADLPPDALAEAVKAADVAVRRTAAELDARWKQEWLPEIQKLLAELWAFDTETAALPDLLRNLTEVRRRMDRLWELHSIVLGPAVMAISDFEDAYRVLFPDARPFDPYDLLAGLPNKTVEQNIALWELGRAAGKTDTLRAVVLESQPEALAATLAQTSEGRALWSRIAEYAKVYGERSDDLYIDAPTWAEDLTPILRGLREAVLHPEWDLAMELHRQAEHRDKRLAEVRKQLEGHPIAVRAELEALLEAAQVGTALSEDHHFWVDTKATFHARRAAIAVGKRLAEAGALEQASDVFYLSLAELTDLADRDPAAAGLRERIAARRAEEARFTNAPHPVLLGTPQAFPALDSALMKSGFKLNGNLMAPPQSGSELRGMPGSRGKAAGRARVVRTLDEAEQKLARGEILVAPATLPSWTPFFANAAAVVTGAGGILCHAAVVAREYGIPAVVSVRGVMDAIHDGEMIEVDGDEGIVRVLPI